MHMVLIRSQVNVHVDSVACQLYLPVQWSISRRTSIVSLAPHKLTAVRIACVSTGARTSSSLLQWRGCCGCTLGSQLCLHLNYRTNASTKTMPNDELGMLTFIQQGASWSKKLTPTIGHSDDNVRDFCGQIVLDDTHEIWTCSALDDTRKIELRTISKYFDIQEVHPAMFRGIAPTMSV